MISKFTAPPITPEQLYYQEQRKRQSDENEIRIGQVIAESHAMGLKRYEPSREKHGI